MTIALFAAVQGTSPCAKMPTIGYSKKGPMPNQSAQAPN
jgi:hypothetical protein